MIFGSLFSGCGGMDGGLEDAGLSCAWQVEIDKACLSVLRQHWPRIPKHEDITKIQEGDLAPVDLIAGGSPCQDLSVAGRGEGLAGERSGLFHQFVRIADSQPSAWILWENVPGALSSNEGADFGIVLRELSGFWPTMPPGGWRGSGFCAGRKRALCWRVLDSQYFGVAQQRERVFIVGGPRDDGSPAQVLFEPESLPGHPPQSNEARTRIAGLLAGSAGGRGDSGVTKTLGCGYGARRGAAQSNRSDPQIIVCGALSASQGGADDVAAQARHLVAAPLTARPYADHAAQEGNFVAFGGNRTAGERATSAAVNTRGGNRLDYESETLITYRKAQKAHHTEDCGNRGQGVINSGGVRRLTPLECERLQGFPDHWTRWADDGRELKDSPRYRMIGNAVTWPVAEWIGRRLIAAMEPRI